MVESAGPVGRSCTPPRVCVGPEAYGSSPVVGAHDWSSTPLAVTRTSRSRAMPPPSSDLVGPAVSSRSRQGRAALSSRRGQADCRPLRSLRGEMEARVKAVVRERAVGLRPLEPAIDSGRPVRTLRSGRMKSTSHVWQALLTAPSSCATVGIASSRNSCGSRSPRSTSTTTSSGRSASCWRDDPFQAARSRARKTSTSHIDLDSRAHSVATASLPTTCSISSSVTGIRPQAASTGEPARPTPTTSKTSRSRRGMPSLRHS